jgi:hypothetical protein
MSLVRTLVTQSGNDTTTSVSIETNLTADGKALWEILGLECYWVDGAAVAAADWSLDAYVGTVTGALAASSADRIASNSWGMQNTGGVAVAVPYKPMQRNILMESRFTAQPNLFMTVQSSGTGQANDVILIVQYRIVKSTDNEVLRMLVGGA